MALRVLHCGEVQIREGAEKRTVEWSDPKPGEVHPGE